MFCNEYFLQEALYQDDNFTMTRHFLIAEQSPADVYYLPYLDYISNWRLGQDGKYRELGFKDGKICRLTPEEVVTSEEIIRYAKRYLEIKEE